MHGYVEFQTEVAGQPDTGGFTDIPRPTLRSRCRAHLGTADYDSGWQEIAGPVDVSVVWVDLRLRGGRHVGAAPRPLHGRGTHPWLRGFRWMSAFLPRSSRVTGVSAYNARGRVVTRARSHGGLFLCR
jgi:hypothetical protein